MIVLIGDVGTPGGLYHLGDEAMLEAALTALRDRGLDQPTVISSDPGSTTERYATPAIGRIGFAGLDTASIDARLSAVAATAHGERDRLSPTDPAHAVIAAVAESDGVVMAGGGNLSVLWPEHVAERLALARIARALGRTVIVSGQMIGPHLDARTGEQIAEILGSAALVGVRDAASLDIAQRLVGKHPIALLADDAVLLGTSGASDTSLHEEATGPVVVTLAPWLGGLAIDDVVTDLTTLIAEACDVVGTDALFVPHVGTIGRRDDGDSALHARVAEQLGQGRIEGLLPAAEAARLHRTAAFTVSSRYHPLAFASSAGRPALGVTVDEYTATKMRGALGFAGAQHALLPLGAVATRAARTRVSDLWRARDRFRSTALARLHEIERAQREWWDAVAEALTRGHAPTLALAVEPAPPVALDDVEGGAELERLSGSLLAAGTDRALERARAAMLHASIARAEADRDAAQRDAADARSELNRCTETIRELELALDAAHRVQRNLADPALRRSLSRNVERYIPPSTIEALLDTRSFRWSRGARRLVGALRRMTGRARG